MIDDKTIAKLKLAGGQTLEITDPKELKRLQEWNGEGCHTVAHRLGECNFPKSYVKSLKTSKK